MISFHFIKKIRKQYFFTLCFISFVVWDLSEYRPVVVKIKTTTGQSSIQMSRREKKQITYLFYKIFIQNSGVYTLFGAKPTNIHSYISPFTISAGKYAFLDSIRIANLRTAQSWKTWEKYAHVMSNSPFLFWAEKSNSIDQDFFITIFLLDKEEFAKTICKHSADFQQVLQKSEINSRALLREAEQLPLLTVLREHDGLIGTILGYGRNNAWLFEERKQGKSTPLVPIWDDAIYDFLGNRPREMQLKDLSKVLGYPTFLADPNSLETQELKKKLLATRQQILNYYEGKDFLEATLSLLVGN